MIQLTENLYIDSDTMNYIVKRKDIIQDEKSKNFGKPNYVAIAYHGTLDSLVRGLIESKTKALMSDAVTLTELSKSIDVYVKQLKTILQKKEIDHDL